MTIAEKERPVTGMATVGVLGSPFLLSHVPILDIVILPILASLIMPPIHQLTQRATYIYLSHSSSGSIRRASRNYITRDTSCTGHTRSDSAELALCDGLIIPGGRAHRYITCATSKSIGTIARVYQDQAVWELVLGRFCWHLGALRVLKGAVRRFLVVLTSGLGETDLDHTKLESFEAELEVNGLADEGRPFNGIFIRAPIILSFTEPDPKRL
ncbi:glutamine amidotransferase [Rhizoctonia solani]|uniref:Glutamine amidotransferase n=1 Tax=Rhizoctonia solani TaxID=456999 RepID=A0A8H7II50_9AGAM|nr:glutamine amidotransferase [Rhizoctonia solani]